MNSKNGEILKSFSLSGKVIVLTGAAGLLGSEYAKALCQSGANVVLADLDFPKCKKISKDLEKKYSSPKKILDGCHWINCDIGVYGGPTKQSKFLINEYINILRGLKNKNVIFDSLH